jgi:hypothetical protein
LDDVLRGINLSGDFNLGGLQKLADLLSKDEVSAESILENRIIVKDLIAKYMNLINKTVHQPNMEEGNISFYTEVLKTLSDGNREKSVREVLEELKSQIEASEVINQYESSGLNYNRYRDSILGVLAPAA